MIAHFQKVAKELEVVLPISFFEKDNQAYYNSIAIIDADGEVLGVYRKSHIPDGPGYEEKFYFNPGDTGFKVWDTKYCKLGVAICWDQWFPEAARIMTLMGAEVIMYPTAIGSEPQDTGINSSGHWRRTMQGHSAVMFIRQYLMFRPTTFPLLLVTVLVRNMVITASFSSMVLPSLLILLVPLLLMLVRIGRLS